MADQTERLAIIVNAQYLGGRALKAVSKDLGGLEKASLRAGHIAAGGVGKAIGNIERLGAVAAGAGVVAGTAVIRMAMDWETAFAGVRKTVNATDAELVTMGKDIRLMATQIPVAATELAGIAEAAGALGIRKADILGFTKVVAELGVTTDLTSAQAADSLGHLKTTLGLVGSDFEHFGNTLVDLGNNGASTESQILGMAEAIAGVSKIVGLSKAQTLGWGSALANTGEEVEAGGSSIQKFMLGVFGMVNKGGKDLNLLAKTAGMTAAQFKKSFAKDASGTLEKFIVQLGKMSKAEQVATLQKLGFTDIRITRAMLKLLGNTKNLTTSLDQADSAWAKNNAMQIEAQKRFETTASQVQLLKNNMTEAGITIGSKLLPVINELAHEGIAWLQDHPEDIERFANALAAGFRDAVKWAKSLDWTAIGDSLKTAAGAAKTVVDMFMSAPPWLQQAVVTGWGLNKLTGGAVVGVGAALGKGLLGSLTGSLGGLFQRGASPAAPMYTKEVGLGGAGAGVAGAGAMASLGKVIGGAFAIVAAASIAEEIHKAISPDGGLEGRVAKGTELPADKLSWPWGPKNTPKIDVGPFEDIFGGGHGAGMNAMRYAPPVYGPPAPGGGGDTRSEQIHTMEANTAALKAATAATLRTEHAKARTAVGGEGKGFHDFLLAFRTGGATVAIKNFPKEFHYLQTASDTLRTSAGYQRGVRENIATLKRDMVGATADQKRKLSADITAMRSLLIPTNTSVIAAVGAGATKVANAVSDIHVLVNGAPAGDAKDWVKYPHDGLTWARGGTGMSQGPARLPGLGVFGEAGNEAFAIVRHPRPINAAAARQMSLHATIVIPPLTIDPRGAAHGEYRFKATTLGQAG
jgi:TP901 family phage tail tape measure protein